MGTFEAIEDVNNKEGQREPLILPLKVSLKGKLLLVN